MGSTVEPKICIPGTPLLAGFVANSEPFPQLLSCRDTAFPPHD